MPPHVSNEMPSEYDCRLYEPKYETFQQSPDTSGHPVYAKERPQVLDYAKFVVSKDGAAKLAGDNGFAPLPDSVYAEYQAQLEKLSQ